MYAENYSIGLVKDAAKIALVRSCKIEEESMQPEKVPGIPFRRRLGGLEQRHCGFGECLEKMSKTDTRIRAFSAVW